MKKKTEKMTKYLIEYRKEKYICVLFSNCDNHCELTDELLLFCKL